MPAMMREVVAAYRDARRRAGRMTSARLRHAEAALRESATDGLDGLDQVARSELMALRDELHLRGEPVPAIAARPAARTGARG